MSEDQDAAYAAHVLATRHLPGTGDPFADGDIDSRPPPIETSSAPAGITHLAPHRAPFFRFGEDDGA